MPEISPNRAIDLLGARSAYFEWSLHDITPIPAKELRFGMKCFEVGSLNLLAKLTGLVMGVN